NTSPYHIHLAATVEFIHTATLLHDDVVDESKQRRGRPTANLLWDNQSSVLVGDYLFSRSFQLMVETGNLRVLDILANASATIAEGEVLQLTVAQNLSTTEDTYLKVIRGKTAALFEAACKVGGVISNANEKIINALASYGDALGICFQITDDYLDYNGSAANLGKSIGDDFRERKMSLPLIKVLKKSNAAEKDFWKRTIEIGDQKNNDLDYALELMSKHNALNDTLNDAVFWSNKAKESITILPRSPLRDVLLELPDYVVSRLS
ncbi:MAG: polyprenyl synthetase family protein, partial [Amylibacter sp.]|nr:polyprenyl synthetase family protein [Amylibacter sp.]